MGGWPAEHAASHIIQQTVFGQQRLRNWAFCAWNQQLYKPHLMPLIPLNVTCCTDVTPFSQSLWHISCDVPQSVPLLLGAVILPSRLESSVCLSVNTVHCKREVLVFRCGVNFIVRIIHLELAGISQWRNSTLLRAGSGHKCPGFVLLSHIKQLHQWNALSDDG